MLVTVGGLIRSSIAAKHGRRTWCPVAFDIQLEVEPSVATTNHKLVKNIEKRELSVRYRGWEHGKDMWSAYVWVMAAKYLGV